MMPIVNRTLDLDEMPDVSAFCSCFAFSFSFSFLTSSSFAFSTSLMWALTTATALPATTAPPTTDNPSWARLTGWLLTSASFLTTSSLVSLTVFRCFDGLVAILSYAVVTALCSAYARVAVATTGFSFKTLTWFLNAPVQVFFSSSFFFLSFLRSSTMSIKSFSTASFSAATLGSTAVPLLPSVASIENTQTTATRAMTPNPSPPAISAVLRDSINNRPRRTMRLRRNAAGQPGVPLCSQPVSAAQHRDGLRG